jgi:Zn-dependent peptidase ImmA (M78 family)
MEEIEQRAVHVLEELPEFIWTDGTLPIPVEEIADSHFNLRVCEVELEEMLALPGAPRLDNGQSLSGLLLANRREIWVNAEEAEIAPARRRFTICHELGHWIMHSVGGKPLFCRSTGIDPPEDADPDVPDIEEEASAFAAALLMPAELMEREYRRDREFWSLCDRFGVSGQAMSRRLRAVI